jgi:uracil-DNA glycosylase
MVWRALNYFNPSELKVVILGQDPYHDPGTANGLSFATSKTGFIPPSLRNILNRIKSEEAGDDALLTHALTTRDSTRVWGKRQAEQGVLLLNTALTVERGAPNSHSTFWEPVTKSLIKEIMLKTKDIVWILWGSYAMNLFDSCYKESGTDNNHITVRSTHPSPFSANKSSKNAVAFNEASIFTKVNEHLEALQKETIKW